MYAIVYCNKLILLHLHFAFLMLPACSLVLTAIRSQWCNLLWNACWPIAIFVVASTWPKPRCPTKESNRRDSKGLNTTSPTITDGIVLFELLVSCIYVFVCVSGSSFICVLVFRNLIAKMLCPKSDLRISIGQLMTHSWIYGHFFQEYPELNDVWKRKVG